jgi:hypothetical protein
MMPARQWPQPMVPSPTPKMPKASKLTSPQNVRELKLRLLCLLRHPSACLITPISILKHTAAVIIFAISEVRWTKFLHLMTYLLGRAPLVWGTSFLRTGAVFLQVSPDLCLHLLPPWRHGQRADEYSSGVGLLICVEDPGSICGGIIANSIGRRFCTRASCTVKSHRSQKIILKANSLHVRGRKDQARLEPSLLISKLPADVTVESSSSKRKGLAFGRLSLLGWM